MTDWSKLKVPELKAELKKRDLAVAGLKADLVAKLEEDDAKNSSTPAGETATPEKAEFPAKDITTNAPKQESELPSETPEPPSAYIPTPSIEPVEMQATTATEAAEAVAKDETPSKEDIPPVVADEAAPTLPRVDTRELTEDLEKRKRRSPSPPPALDMNGQAKRQKITGDADDVTVATTTEDAQWVEGHNNVDPGTVNAEATEVAIEGGAEPGPTIVDTSKEEVVVEHAAGSLAANAEQSAEQDTTMKDISDNAKLDSQSDVKMEDAPLDRRSRSRSRSPAAYDRRSRSPRDYRDRSPLPDQEERTITPAIHPATSALYIRDFQRPLNKSELQDFITELATAPGQSPDPEVIVNFFLDNICTHAFVEFGTTTAASRVRSLIHGRTWPQETTRRPLWADFIPDNRVGEWIETEKESQDRRERKKWEVVYSTMDDEVVANLQEADAVPAQFLRKQSDDRGMDNAPRGPRADRDRFAPSGIALRGGGDSRDPNYMPLDGAPSGPRDPYADRMQPTGPRAGLRAPVDAIELVTQPPIMFVPVSKDVAEARMAHIDGLYAPDPDADFRVRSQKHRYTFDRDTLIDRGVEVFEGIRKPPGVRRMPLPADITGTMGPRRARGGRGRDGYRGGGGGGGAYMDGPRYRDYRDGGMRGGPRGGGGYSGGGGGFDRQDRFAGDRWTPSGGGGGGYGGGGRLDRGDPNPYPPRGGGGYGGGGGGYGRR